MTEVHSSIDSNHVRIDLSAGITSDRYDPTQLRAKITPDRWRDLHENRRILIVDDNPDTAGNLREVLGDLYGQVDTETDPTLVSEKLAKAVKQGRPYDVVVLDLYMPKKSGVELLKEIMTEGPKAAVVVNTASMMAPVMADISAQMDSYSSASALTVLEALSGPDSALQAPHHQNFGILLHFKLEGLASLIDKIDAAQLFQRHAPQSMQTFWRGFDPLLIPVNFSAEAVHHFSEHLRNFMHEFKAVWSSLEEDQALRDSKWWGQGAARIRRALSHLEQVSFGNLMDETPAGIRNRVHTALNFFAQLNPDWAGQTLHTDLTGGDSAAGLSSWKRLFLGYKGKLNVIYDDFQTYHAAEFDYISFCMEQFKDLGVSSFLSSQVRRQPASPLKDPERAIRNLLLRLAGRFRELNGKAWTSIQIHPGYFPERERMHEREDDRQRLEGINCGDYFALNTSFDCNSTTLDEFFADLLPDMSVLARKKLITWSQNSWLNGSQRRWQFNLAIKASEKTLDFEAEKRERAKKGPDGARLIITDWNEIPIQEDLGPAKNVILVGDLPEEFSPLQGPVLYKMGEFILFASGPSHLDASNLIAQYLEYIKGKEPDSAVAAAIGTIDPIAIYIDCVRARGFYDTFTIEEDDSSGWAIEALVALGFEREQIRVNPYDFGSRAY